MKQKNAAPNQSSSSNSFLHQGLDQLNSYLASNTESLESVARSYREEVAKLKQDRSKAIEQLHQRFDQQSQLLRKESEQLKTDAPTACIYFYGGQVASQGVILERYGDLSQKISAQAKSFSYVPVVLCYKESFGNPFKEAVSETRMSALVLVPSLFADRSFLVSSRREMASDHAFTNKQVAVIKSSIALRGRTLIYYGGFYPQDTFDFCHREQCKDLKLAEKCIAEDPKERRSYSGEYSRSDWYDDNFITDDDLRKNSNRHQSGSYQVGWDEIAIYLKELSNSNRAVAFNNIFEGLSESFQNRPKLQSRVRADISKSKLATIFNRAYEKVRSNRAMDEGLNFL